MASLEQLQMLNDDETTSSSSSNRSDDEEEGNLKKKASSASTGDVAFSNDLTEHDEDDRYKKANSEGSSASMIGGGGHHPKRMKLSIDGAFKSMESSPKNVIQEQQTKLKNVNSIAVAGTHDDMNSKSIKKLCRKHSPPPTDPPVSTLTPRNDNFRIRNSKSETDNTSGDEDSSRITTKLKHTSEGKKSNSKAKLTSIAASSSVTNKAKENKRRQLPKSPSPSLTFAGENLSSCTKKRSSIRGIRITPMSSPGLLFPMGINVRGGGNTNITNNISTSSSPNSAFTQTMANAGYTKESRIKTPHRGSSVQRIVDDMFDSNVKFCLSFPIFFPRDFLFSASVSPKTATSLAKGVHQKSSAGCSSGATVEIAKIKPLKTSSTKDSSTIKLESTENNGVEDTEPKTIPILIKRILKAFPTNKKENICSSVSSLKQSSMHGTKSLFSTNANTHTKTSRNQRSRNPQYKDIIPVSLSFTYPDEYIKQRLEYVLKVDNREKAIVALQEKEDLHQGASNAMFTKIPPIPNPPGITMQDDVSDNTKDENIFGSNDQQQRSHPLYLPKNQVLVDHLDKRCFHIVHGRYFGLSSNSIVDPNFCGPNAPCIGGLNLSASTGLATASSGGGAGSPGVPLFSISVQPLSMSTNNSKIASLSTTSL